jgi:hypothetical protein
MAKGLVFWLLYNLWRRRVGWIPFGVALLAILVAAGIIISPIFLALSFLFVILSYWAYRSGFLHFQPEQFSIEEIAPLGPEEKVFVRASGPFEVERKRGYFVDLAAAFEGFCTAEKVVMAYVPPSPFWPKGEVGMWYFFFRPDEVKGVEWGRIFFGLHSLPALRLTCQTAKGSSVLFLASGELSRLERIRQFITIESARRENAGSG